MVQPVIPLWAPVEERSTHPLFLFLPGMDGTGLLFNRQANALKQHFDIRCAALLPSRDDSWETLAEQVIQALQAEQKKIPDREIVLCGESFGGCLALLVAMKAPALVNGLIVVNPATAFIRRFWATWAASIIKLLPDVSYALACSVLLPFLADLSEVDIHEAQALVSAMQSVGYEVAAQRVELLSRFPLTTGDYRRITQPTLIVASDRDRLLPSVDEGYWLASLIPNATVHRLPNSGHACLLERNMELMAIMKASQFDVGVTAGAQHSVSLVS